MSCPCSPCYPCSPPKPPPCGKPCPPPPPPPICRAKPHMVDLHYKQNMATLRSLFGLIVGAVGLATFLLKQKRKNDYALYKKENDFEEQASLMAKQELFKSVETEEEIRERKKKQKK